MERELLLQRGQCIHVAWLECGLRGNISLSILRRIELSLPKFSISTDYSLEKILPQLGIREVFSTHADLSGITGSRELRVSQVSSDTLGDCHWYLNVDGEARRVRDGTCERKPASLRFPHPGLQLRYTQEKPCSQPLLYALKKTSPRSPGQGRAFAWS